ncbi:GNAT family N-acetyltransferase [Actinomadura sp. DC4]|uniref:GNAT family N-acetyltransferase n=1 Tax=Actinomadura sp. DC4 TaxID=3055069 RepID=UPI0025B21A31|nr:GNAT family N-acetyltransferase [Actinomadura sp. DC4]MDN3353059.1 GNAT family N-acetyltransferase [Actinomadura sp. DC4]
MNTNFTIRRATPGEHSLVIDLIEEASDWLRAKKTDQWADPWPTRNDRDARVLAGLERGETWLVWDGRAPAATMTICQEPIPHVWGKSGRGDAVYVHRLVVGRAYAGHDLGGVMIDWAVQRELRTRPVEWVRVDVWTTNEGLHAYYRRQGFIRCGTCADPKYPSGALFQKSADTAPKTDTSFLEET